MSTRTTANNELFADYIRRTRDEQGYTPFEYWQPPKKVQSRGPRKSSSKEFLNRRNEPQRRVARMTSGARQPSQPRPKTAPSRQMHEVMEARMMKQRQQRWHQQQRRLKDPGVGPSNRDSAVVLEPLEEHADESLGYRRQTLVPPTYQDAVRLGRGTGRSPNPASVMDEKRLLAAASNSARDIEEHPALRGGGESIVSDDSKSENGSSWCRNKDVPKKGFRTWRKRTWALIVALVVFLLTIAIAVPVAIKIEQERNRYPDYFKINYTLSETYSGANFFDKFDYYSGPDPTHGFVKYVTREQAELYNLTSASSTSAVLRVDTSAGPKTIPDASTGRMSVRVESRQQYDRGLFLFDVKHTPFGCGTWPALWLAGLSSWPRDGEIDLMEATHLGTSGNLQSLHTTQECSMAGVRRMMTGAAAKTDCYNGTEQNSGCGVHGNGPDTYGPGFNKAGGGLVAVELRNEGIRTWQFPRGTVPPDIEAGIPDPSIWGPAMADFPSTQCDIGRHFRNQSIILNIALCGDWGEATYADAGCPSNCTDYVTRTPSAFTDAFWEFGAFQVYEPTMK